METTELKEVLDKLGIKEKNAVIFTGTEDWHASDKDYLPVYAAAEGYVSRIKVQSGGYGKALYIDHPGNITTVYAHLHAFTGLVADTVSFIQISAMEFEMDVFPTENSIMIEKGQLIGYSGNSGSSYGPHLHYEYRHTASQRPFDPSLMGMTVADTIAPELTSLVLYTPGEFDGIFGSERHLIMPVSGHFPDTISTDLESVFIGFSIYERANDSKNPLGLKSALVLNGIDTVFYSSVDSFLYSETRYANSLSDPLLGDSLNKLIYIAVKLPGNELDQVIATDYGSIRVDSNQLNEIRMVLTDRADNQTIQKFILKYDNKSARQGICFTDDGAKIQRKRRFRKREGNLRVEFDKYSFYEDVRLRINCIENKAGIADSYELGTPGLPVHRPFILQFRSDITDKRTGVICAQGNDTTWIGGELQRNMLTARTRSFGMFTLAVDTTPPGLSNDLLVLEHDSILNMNVINIGMTDDLSGVDRVTTYLNGIQVVNEFNSYRNETAVYMKAVEADKPLKLRIRITDKAGNIAEEEFIVNRK
jgi:murein DD-endopeptidase MepM/ murein hydrolase activator NlpD